MYSLKPINDFLKQGASDKLIPIKKLDEIKNCPIIVKITGGYTNEDKRHIHVIKDYNPRYWELTKVTLEKSKVAWDIIDSTTKDLKFLGGRSAPYDVLIKQEFLDNPDIKTGLHFILLQ